MTSHEIARHLLSMEDLPVVEFDGLPHIEDIIDTNHQDYRPMTEEEDDDIDYDNCEEGPLRTKYFEAMPKVRAVVFDWGFAPEEVL